MLVKWIMDGERKLIESKTQNKCSCVCVRVCKRLSIFHSFSSSHTHIRGNGASEREAERTRKWTRGRKKSSVTRKNNGHILCDMWRKKDTTWVCVWACVRACVCLCADATCKYYTRCYCDIGAKKFRACFVFRLPLSFIVGSFLICKCSRVSTIIVWLAFLVWKCISVYVCVYVDVHYSISYVCVEIMITSD